MPNDKGRDPFLDDDFAPLDTRKGSPLVDEKFVQENASPEELEKIKAANAPPAPSDIEDQEPAAAAPVEPQPELYQYDDGSSVLIEVTPSGVKATLDPGSGAGKEIFHGQTESDVLRQVLSAKLEATKKIRQQNRELKLGRPSEEPVEEATFEARQLTADEIFGIQKQLQANPALAVDEIFQKTVGMSLAELRRLLVASQENIEAQDAVTIVQLFLNSHPTYTVTRENYATMIGYLSQKYLKRALKAGEEDETSGRLYMEGFFTEETLDEAFESLAADGLLELNVEPTEPETKEEPVQPIKVVPKPQPVTPKPGIPAGRVRPRVAAGSFGLHAGEASSQVPASETAPSAEELEDLSTEDINKLFGDVRKFKVATRR